MGCSDGDGEWKGRDDTCLDSREELLCVCVCMYKLQSHQKEMNSPNS